MYFWDKNGSSIAPQEITPFVTDFSPLSNSAGGIAAMVRPGGFTTAPANAVYATLDVIAFTSGAGPASLTIQAPMLRIAQAGATELAAATPGVGIPNADQTGTNVAASVSGQGPLATTPTPVSAVLNTNVATGTNLVVDSAYQLGLGAFGPGFSSPLAPAAISRQFTTGAYGRLVQAYIPAGVGAGAPAGVFDIFMSDPFNGAALSDLQRYACPVADGDSFYGSVLALYGNGASGVECVVFWFDVNGTYLSASISAIGGASVGGDFTGLNGDSSHFSRVGLFCTPPAGTRFATIGARVVYPAGLGSDAHSAAMQPFLAKVTAGQAAVPAYTVGTPDRAADQTSANVSSAVAGQGSLATQSAVNLSSNQTTGSLAATSSIYAGGATVQSLQPLTAQSDKTANAVASGIAGQGSLATLSTVALGSQVTGALPAGSVSYTNGASAQSLQPATSSADKTSNAVASAVAGQGPLATAPNTITSITSATPNLVYDGGFSLGAQGWALGAGVGTVGGSGDGPYLYFQSNGTVVSTSPVFTAAAGLTYTLQAEMFNGGLTGVGDFCVDIQFNTVGGAALPSQSVRLSVATAGSWAQHSVQITAPSSAAVGYVRVFTESVTLASGVAVRKIKVALSSEATVFSDEATTGALYRSGATIDSLQPAQAGSDVTGTHVASSVAGQGTLATANSVALGSQTTGTLPASSSTYANGSTVQSQQPATTNADQTSVSVASSVAGQGSLATASSVALGTQTTGSLPAVSVSYTSGATAQSLQPATPSADKTSNAVASSVAGQGPLATASNSVTSLTSAYPNLIYNGGFKLGSKGWSLAAGSAVTAAGSSAGDGPYIYMTANGTNVNNSPQFTAAAGLTYTLQGELFSGGLQGGDMVVNVLFLNSSGSVVLDSPRLTLVNQQSWTSQSATFTAPAGTVAGYVRVFTEGATISGSVCAVRKIKLALASEASVFSDEATTGALYDDKSDMQSLKPRQAGADPTGSNTAASISGQGSLATSNAVNLATQVGGTLAAGSVGYSAGGTVDSLRPAQSGADVTGSHVASSISGQGSFATISSAYVENGALFTLAQRLLADGYGYLRRRVHELRHPRHVQLGSGERPQAPGGRLQRHREPHSKRHQRPGLPRDAEQDHRRSPASARRRDRHAGNAQPALSDVLHQRGRRQYRSQHLHVHRQRSDDQSAVRQLQRNRRTDVLDHLRHHQPELQLLHLVSLRSGAGRVLHLSG